jgi:hypothetical protein
MSRAARVCRLSARVHARARTHTHAHTHTPNTTTPHAHARTQTGTQPDTDSTTPTQFSGAAVWCCSGPSATHTGPWTPRTWWRLCGRTSGDHAFFFSSSSSSPACAQRTGIQRRKITAIIMQAGRQAGEPPPTCVFRSLVPGSPLIGRFHRLLLPFFANPTAQPKPSAAETASSRRRRRHPTRRRPPSPASSPTLHDISRTSFSPDPRWRRRTRHADSVGVDISAFLSRPPCRRACVHCVQGAACLRKDENDDVKQTPSPWPG